MDETLDIQIIAAEASIRLEANEYGWGDERDRCCRSRVIDLETIYDAWKELKPAAKPKELDSEKVVEDTPEVFDRTKFLREKFRGKPRQEEDEDPSPTLKEDPTKILRKEVFDVGDEDID